jgi:hypothetical protein
MRRSVFLIFSLVLFAATVYAEGVAAAPSSETAPLIPTETCQQLVKNAEAGKFSWQTDLLFGIDPKLLKEQGIDCHCLPDCLKKYRIQKAKEELRTARAATNPVEEIFKIFDQYCSSICLKWPYEHYQPIVIAFTEVEATKSELYAYYCHRAYEFHKFAGQPYLAVTGDIGMARNLYEKASNEPTILSLVKQLDRSDVVDVYLTKAKLEQWGKAMTEFQELIDIGNAYFQMPGSPGKN